MTTKTKATTKTKKSYKTQEERMLAIAAGMQVARDIYIGLFTTESQSSPIDLLDEEIVLQIFDNLDVDDEDLPLEDQAQYVEEIKIARGTAIELFGDVKGRKPSVVMEVYERLYEVGEDEE